jgi:hypothetical protein
LFEAGDVIAGPDELRGFVGWEVSAFGVCCHVGVVLLCYRVIVLLLCVLWVGKRVASRVCGEVMRQKWGRLEAFGGVGCTCAGLGYAYTGGGCARVEGGCTYTFRGRVVHPGQVCAWERRVYVCEGEVYACGGEVRVHLSGRIVHSGRVYAYPAWGKACFWGGRYAQVTERRRGGRV